MKKLILCGLGIHDLAVVASPTKKWHRYYVGCRRCERILSLPLVTEVEEPKRIVPTGNGKLVKRNGKWKII